MRSVLIDAERRHDENPETFEIPGVKSRLSIQIGDYAKLMFENDAKKVERMWVEVTYISGHGRYSGKLDSRPALSHGELHQGTYLDFEARHVIQIAKTQNVIREAN